MSQRTPSHWSAIEPSVSITAARRSGEKAFSCTTSGQAGKYGSRPLASTRSPTLTNEAGSCSRSRSLPRTKYSGCAEVHAMVGRHVVRHEVEDQLQAASLELPAGRGEALRAAELARQPGSRGCSTANRPRPQRRNPAAHAGSSPRAHRSRGRSRSRPGCAPRRPSARRRRSRALRSRPTPPRRPRRDRCFLRCGAPARRARPTC